MNVQPFLFGEGWIEVRDGNDTARALFDRHYSRYFYADGRKLAKSRASESLAELRAQGVTAAAIRQRLGFA